MAGKPDTRELAHGGFVTAAVNAIIRILRHGTRKGPPAIAFPPFPPPYPVVAIGCVTTLALMLGLPLTYAYGGARTFGYLAGGAGLSVVLIYLAVNVSAIHAFRTGFRDDFRSCRHLVRPATVVVTCCFPSGGSFTRAAGL